MIKELGTFKCEKLNSFFKQMTTLLVVLSLIIPQNLFANNPPDGSEVEQEKIELAPERLDFSDVKDAGEVFTLNTTTTTKDGRKVDIDLIQGEVKAHETDRILTVLKQIEPQLKEAYELNPETRFEPVFVSEEGTKYQLDMSAAEVLQYLNDIREGKITHVEVKTSTAQKIRSFFTTVFEKTTKEDVKWALWRLGINGSSASISFWLANIPIPISAILGYGLIGGGSAGIALLIEKFSGWLDKNKINPKTPIRNRLGSIETFMLASPLLIALQSTGVTTADGMLALGATAGAAIIMQNIYLFLKKHSPQTAFIYRWGATETIFVAAPALALPFWGVFSPDVKEAIQWTYIYASMATASQGIWEKLIISVRKSPLNVAVQQDAMLLTERIAGKDIFHMKYRDRTAFLKQNEFLARKPYKQFFFWASVASVASSIAGNTGNYMGLDFLSISGKVGLGLLGLSGLWYTYKHWRGKKVAANQIWAETKGGTAPTKTAEDIIRLQNPTSVVQKPTNIIQRTCNRFFGKK